MTVHVGHDSSIEEGLGGYEVKSAEVYRAVAEKSATVVETLHDLRNVARRFFGEVPIRLCVQPDPDIPGYAPIYAEIRTPRTMQDSSERLQRFDEATLEKLMKEPAEIYFMIVPQ